MAVSDPAVGRSPSLLVRSPEAAGSAHQRAPGSRESRAWYMAFRTVGALSETVPESGWPNSLTMPGVPAAAARSRTAPKSPAYWPSSALPHMKTPEIAFWS